MVYHAGTLLGGCPGRAGMASELHGGGWQEYFPICLPNGECLEPPQEGCCIQNVVPSLGTGSVKNSLLEKHCPSVEGAGQTAQHSRQKTSGQTEQRYREQVLTDDTRQMLSSTPKTRLWANPRSFREPNTPAAAGRGVSLSLALPMAREQEWHPVLPPLCCPWPGLLTLSWGLKMDLKCFICKPLTKITLTCK